ncbi:alpha-ketoglutarate-dependent dioxygenase AlkB family protein [Dyadobacter subterraneus]|uniref:Alpha-ketoglutarate-dependent dioxygenase AlkB n=1 Tax=Dyadobacter subterraneus TaxID=2773304 RepID=A0ABR9W7I6_9BACT|nr:alpha-ketoglutarate-dependent dioxygenase AlkB [Dyadobacter subterraneus]MBE9461429.1 alpha-ketoglutarate-dependent dioxygenase AlkB [Dyadobacter subterraneus]
MQQLSLFDANESLSFPENLLEYFPGFLDPQQSISLMHQLIKKTPWRQQIIQMYGKEVITPRLTAWFGDSNKSYQFSGTKFDPVPWTLELYELKEKIQKATGLPFNSVLLNFYRDGNDSVAWHSDNEKELGINPHIASLSIGQARQFEFRNKSDHSRKYGLSLENGSLLIMKGDLQHNWEHRIPKSKKLNNERINLTFRSII